jgi:hypothetical protein
MRPTAVTLRYRVACRVRSVRREVRMSKHHKLWVLMRKRLPRSLHNAPLNIFVSLGTIMAYHGRLWLPLVATNHQYASVPISNRR